MFAPVLTSIIDSYGHIGRPSFEHSAETLLYAVDFVDPSLDEFFGRPCPILAVTNCSPGRWSSNKIPNLRISRVRGPTAPRTQCAGGAYGGHQVQGHRSVPVLICDGQESAGPYGPAAVWVPAGRCQPQPQPRTRLLGAASSPAGTRPAGQASPAPVMSCRRDLT